jgi:hypothetical protein
VAILVAIFIFDANFYPPPRPVLIVVIFSIASLCTVIVPAPIAANGTAL